MNRENALLFKIRHFLNSKTWKTIYYVIFDSHINYANVIWAQNFNPVSECKCLFLKKNVLGINSFQPRDWHLNLLFKKHNLLKFDDKVQLENILLVSKYLLILIIIILNIDNKY